ncbi:MAG: glycosyl hydrolase [Ignavibacteriota bacterium]
MRKWTVVATAILLVESGIAFAQVTFPEGQSKLPEQMERVRQQIQQLGSEPASADLQREIQGTTLQLMSLARGGRGAAPLRSATPAPYTCDPVNPNATPEARTLLKSLCSVSGKGILTGQHNFPNERDVDSNRIFEVTGKYPAIWGSDFGFTSGEDKDAITHRDLMIAEAKKQGSRRVHHLSLLAHAASNGRRTGPARGQLER